ncbi:hypothetical protein DVH05_000482 [Phytophthora capsici]|nr:hypothetical protein DVH05_012389 [Phytophthora capsici]KAG1712746.1 hypothetical protein DVH05_000482 [Phytophthora capsici]
MTFSKDNKKLWLTKPKMKLEFLLVDGLYRMWTRKTTGSTAKAEDHVVLGVEKTSVIGRSAAMGMLHNRLDHAEMDEIRRHTQQFEVEFKATSILRLCSVQNGQIQAYDVQKGTGAPNSTAGAHCC